MVLCDGPAYWGRGMTSEVRDRVTSPVRAREWFSVFAAVSTLPAWWLVLAWYKFMGRRDGHPWVMSGHRGRFKGDSAGALFDYIRNHTDQAVVWLANDNDHTTYMVRNSWRARLAIARAPVLLYSHGEDDLDICLAVCRHLLGIRIYQGHGANLVKRGSMHPQVLRSLSFWRKQAGTFVATDYDMLPCQSGLEKSFWDANRPAKADRHVVVGASARMDRLLQFAVNIPKRRMVWFPTFRDTPEARRALIQTIAAVTAHHDLRQFLVREDFVLDIGVHVNNRGDFSQMTDLPGRISLFETDELLCRLSDAQVLITDYSSVLIDWLLFDRPAVFFAFDLAAYERTRGLHLSYESYVYGRRATTPDELVRLLVEQHWHDCPEDRNRRRQLRGQFLGDVTPGQTARVYDAIRNYVT